jgi:DNA-binding transcriptional MerR regulator
MEYISVENLIKILKERNINFGKGDPYNRLRYYTKIGWLPHMTRMKNETGTITGHYPSSVIEEIIRIEEYKNSGLSNEEITKQLQKNLDQKFNFELIKKVYSKININLIFLTIITIAFLIEITKIGSLYEKINLQNNLKEVPINTEKRIIDYGINFIPKNQNEIFVASSSVVPTSIVMLTFLDDLGYNNNYFIREIIQGQGFYIQTRFPVSKDIKLNWAIIK